MATNQRILAAEELVKKNDIVELSKTRFSGENSDVKVNCFNFTDFTKKGDCIATRVLGISVVSQNEGKENETNYVLKLWPGEKKSSFLTEITRLQFNKEFLFYSKLLESLNDELRLVESPLLSVPKYYFSINEEGRQAVYLQDLRDDGFKLYDRLNSLDVPHLNFVLHELAKLHASSYLYMKKDDSSDIIESSCKDLYDILLIDENSKKWFEHSYSRYAEIAERLKDFSTIVSCLQELKSSGKIIFEALITSEDKFMTICHGNPWINNFMFKYAENGIKPEACKLIDFQCLRKCSLVLDLNLLFFTSLDGDTRGAHVDKLLSTYYDYFVDIIRNSTSEIPFTLEELKAEYSAKNLFGFIMSMDTLADVLIPSDLSFTTEDYTRMEVVEIQKEQDKIIYDNISILKRAREILSDMVKAKVFTEKLTIESVLERIGTRASNN